MRTPPANGDELKLRRALTCAICVGDLRGRLVQFRPLGRDRAMVACCIACTDEHPRSGRYTFGGGVTGEASASHFTRQAFKATR